VSFVGDYLSGVKALVDQVSEEKVHRLADLLETAWRDGKHVILMGNGGSASTASHIVNDLQKCVQLDTGKAIRAMCLCDNTALILAWGNDTEYANIFAPQVECWAEPGDLIIGISGSGNSPNVIRAIEAGNAKGATTFGLAGYEGGKLAEVAKESIVVLTRNMQQIEDVHMILLHLVFSELRRRIVK
jgi:D-sedoheptulose 7-phosphate isomerase